MSKKRVVVFDFDGTLADTIELGRLTFNGVAKKIGCMELSKEEVQHLRGLSSRQVLQYIGIPWYRIPKMIRVLKTEMRVKMSQVTLFEGIGTMLKELHLRGDSLFVVSSNGVDNIDSVLHKHGVKEYFTRVYGDVKAFKKQKVLKQIKQQMKEQIHQHYFIGDETRDVIAAQKANYYSIAVTWGFNKETALLLSNPDALVHVPEHLKNTLEQKNI